MKKQLRDAAIAGATVALLLYAAMTAAKSMAGVMQPSARLSPAGTCNDAVVEKGEVCRSYPDVARREE